MSGFLPHIFIDGRTEAILYKPITSGGGSGSRPPREPLTHAQRLRNELNAAWQRQAETNTDRQAISLSTKEGIYLEFQSHPGFSLKTKSLEDLRYGIRLLNIKETGEEAAKVTTATVFIPTSRAEKFFEKLQQYEESASSPSIKNAELIDSIENIRLALLEAFWQDPLHLLPKRDSKWIEVWLRTNSDPSVAFKALCDSIGVTYRGMTLSFPERVVVLI